MQSSTTGYLAMNYSFAVVDFHSFDSSGAISFFYQLSLQWNDFHRQWNNTVIPVNFIEVPLTELWYPRFQLINTNDKQSVNLVNASTLNAQIYYNSLITLYINDILSGTVLLLLYSQHILFETKQSMCSQVPVRWT